MQEEECWNLLQFGQTESCIFFLHSNKCVEGRPYLCLGYFLPVTSLMLPVYKLPDSEKQTVKSTISVNQLLSILKMSADIHAPDLSLNMREEEENQAKIYENEDTLKQSLGSRKVTKYKITKYFIDVCVCLIKS